LELANGIGLEERSHWAGWLNVLYTGPNGALDREPLSTQTAEGLSRTTSSEPGMALATFSEFHMDSEDLH